MTDFTDYVETEIANWIVGGVDMPTSHGNVYVGLHTGDPTETGDANEVSAASYSRASTTAGTDWTIGTGTFENSSDISFPEAQELWGDVSHFSLWDSQTGGNALGYSSLSSTRTVESGDAPVFRTASLTGQID